MALQLHVAWWRGCVLVEAQDPLLGLAVLVVLQVGISAAGMPGVQRVVPDHVAKGGDDVAEPLGVQACCEQAKHGTPRNVVQRRTTMH